MARKVVWDASDEAQVRASEKDVEDRSRDIEYIMRMERGRRWMHEMIFDTCHIQRLSYVVNDSDSTAFNEGAKSVGLSLLEQVKTNCPKLYRQMMEEHDD